VAHLRVIEQLYSSKAVMWVGILLLAGLSALQTNVPGSSGDVVTL